MIQIRGCAFMWPRCASIVSFFLIKLLTNLLGLTTPFLLATFFLFTLRPFSRCPPFHAVSPFCHVVSPFLSRRLPLSHPPPSPSSPYLWITSRRSPCVHMSVSKSRVVNSTHWLAVVVLEAGVLMDRVHFSKVMYDTCQNSAGRCI